MYQSIVQCLIDFKVNGVPKDQALDCLEFDEYVPDYEVLKQALEEAYKN